MEIGALPSEKSLAKGAVNQAPKASADNPLDLVLEDLSTEQKERFNVSSGVLVQQIEEGVGAKAGIIPGDVITMLNGQRIQSISHLLTVVKESPKNKALPMRIVRRGSPLFVPIKLED